MKNEMSAIRSEFRICFQALRKNWVVIILCTALGLLLGSSMAIIPQPDTYQATGSISKTAASSPSNLAITTFSDLMTSKNVLDEISDKLGTRAVSSSELSSMLSTSSNDSQNILYISATHTDPSFAIEVTNLATEVMARQINEIYSNAGIVVLDQATSARQLSNWSSSAMLYRLLGAVLGAVLCCAVIVIRALTSNKALSISACTLDGEYELVGVIPYIPFEK